MPTQIDLPTQTMNKLPLAKGGTNVDLSASGSATAVLAQDGSHVVSARALVAVDIPGLDAAKITTGQLALARGGTNADLSATGGASQVLKQSGVGAAITVAQLTAGDITGLAAIAASGKWSDLQNATADLTLANAGFNSTFNHTSATNWKWANTTAATVTVPQSSPLWNLSGTYWTGAASAEDKWTFQNVVGVGTNPASALTIAHSGSSGAAQVVFPLGAASKPSVTFIGLLTEGIRTSGTTFILCSSQVVYTELAGNFTFAHSTNGFAALAGSAIGFSSQASNIASGNNPDTRIFRSAAGVMGLGGTSSTTPCNLTMPSANGAAWTLGQSSELLTLSTVGLTTDTVGNLLPANSIIEAVVCRVTTAITVTTNWAVGDANVSSRFSSANATLASGTTSVGINHMAGSVTTDNAGPTQPAAAKVRITCTGANPGAGVVRITVYYKTFTAPTS